MAITRERKAEFVKQYVDQLQRSQGIILVDYRGLSVGEISEVRNVVRSLDGKLQVVHNRLLKRALSEAGMSLPDEWLTGPTLIGFCFGEVPATAKALVDAAKEMELLRFKGASIGASLLQPKEVVTLASLPPREVLLAQVLGTINAPASQVVGVIASGIRQVLNVLQAYVDKLEESGGAAIEAAAEPA